MIDLDQDTRLALIAKAERFQVEYAPDYWGKKQPPEKQKFVNACIIIEELTGFIINMLELEDSEL